MNSVAEINSATETLSLDEKLELLEYKITQKITNEQINKYNELTKTMATEVENHRKHLQKLNDKFYDQIQFWLPAITILSTLLLGLFLWIAGRSQKDAFEIAKLRAETVAINIAEKRVSEIITPQELLDRIENEKNMAITKVESILNQFKENAEDELKKVKDQIVNDSEESILQILEKQKGEKFNDVLDIMSRFKELEGKIDNVNNDLIQIMKIILSLEDHIERLDKKQNYQPPQLGQLSKLQGPQGSWGSISKGILSSLDSKGVPPKDKN
ncbi:hypothetical protein K8I31_01210 [bacterium]|nr:hypothetical protein [bacterium]